MAPPEPPHHLPILGALLDLAHEPLLLRLELGALAVELALCLFERALVLPQPLGRGEAFAKEGVL